REARCAYQIGADPAAITVATTRALREATPYPTGPVYLSISAALLNQEGLEAQIGEEAAYRIEGVAPARAESVDAIARRLGAATCPVLIFGDDVSRQGAQAEAIALAERLEPPVFAGRQIFPNFPSRHALFCGGYPVSAEFKKVTGLPPDLIFLAGCPGVPGPTLRWFSWGGCRGAHGPVGEPRVMQIGPNPLLMGRHYPLDVAVQCELRGTLKALAEALPRVNPAGAAAGKRQREKVRAYAASLISKEEDLVREHEHDATVHPAVLEA